MTKLGFWSPPNFFLPNKGNSAEFGDWVRGVPVHECTQIHDLLYISYSQEMNEFVHLLGHLLGPGLSMICHLLCILFVCSQKINQQYLSVDVCWKHRENREKLHREHLIGCRGVKLFLIKDVTITTFTSANVTTVTITTVTIWVFELSQFDFF